MFGHDIDRELEAAKSCIGLVPQEINFNMFETCFTIVVNQAGFYGIPRSLAKQRAEKYLKQLQLWDRRNSIARALSGGMKRRLMIARALMHEPRLLILDEPTAGVDIEIRRSMWEFLRNINDAGTTIILTTHYLEEAENLCRNIAIIEGGNIIERDSMVNVLRKLQTEVFVFNLRDPRSTAPELQGFSAALPDDRTLEIEMSKTQSLNDIFAQLSAQGIVVNSMRNKVNRLEELFIRLVDGSASAGRAKTAGRVGVVNVPASRARAEWIGFNTIIIREFSRIVRIWGQTIVPPAVTATLYFVIFGSLIGRRVGQVGGYDYMQFIAPGLIMMSVITNSYGNVVSSFFGAKFGKHLEELLVSPLPNWLIVAGYVGGGILRGLLVGGRRDHRVAVLHAFGAHTCARRRLGGVAHQPGVCAGRFHQCAVRQEFRPDFLVPDLRAHPSDLPGRRVLFDHDAARLGRTSCRTPIPSCTWSAPSVTVFSVLRDVDLRLGLWDHGDRGRRHVRAGRGASEPGYRYPRLGVNRMPGGDQNVIRKHDATREHDVTREHNVSRDKRFSHAAAPRPRLAGVRRGCRDRRVDRLCGGGRRLGQRTGRRRGRRRVRAAFRVSPPPARPPNVSSNSASTPICRLRICVPGWSRCPPSRITSVPPTTRRTRISNCRNFASGAGMPPSKRSPCCIPRPAKCRWNSWRPPISPRA